MCVINHNGYSTCWNTHNTTLHRRTTPESAHLHIHKLKVQVANTYANGHHLVPLKLKYLSATPIQDHLQQGTTQLQKWLDTISTTQISQPHIHCKQDGNFIHFWPYQDYYSVRPPFYCPTTRITTPIYTKTNNLSG